VGATQGTFLVDGDVIETEIEGIGVLRNRCVAEDHRPG
jgi:2-keto-4-pentenoate hydratase/2-oxohepta-3-ene-1,7-dioic acid hydratase in catechol pathway